MDQEGKVCSNMDSSTDVEETLETTDQPSMDKNPLDRRVTRSLTKMTDNVQQESILDEVNPIPLFKDDEKEQIPSKSKSDKKKKEKYSKEVLLQALEKLHMDTYKNLAIERPPPAPGTYDVNLFGKPGTTTSTVSPANAIKFDPSHEWPINFLVRQEFVDENKLFDNEFKPWP